MALIKAQHAPPSLQAFSMADIEQQARVILQRARQAGDQILAQARAQAEQLKEQAQADGQAAGRAEGLANGHAEGLKSGKDQALAENRAQLVKLLAALTAAANQIEAQRRELAAAATQDVIELACAIASRVIKRQAQADPSIALANVAEALKLVTHASDVRIAIHPQQKAFLADALPRLKLQWPTLHHVAIVEDATLGPGGCRIYTQSGQIDGDLDEQLRRVTADLVPAAPEAAE